MGSIFKDFFEKAKNNQSNAEVIYTNDPLENRHHQKMRAIVTGRVQGVGFRFSTKQTADELGIKGVVRNESDGTVYVEAVGGQEEINQFIEALRRGPSPAAVVDNVRVTYDEKIEEKTTFSQGN